MKGSVNEILNNNTAANNYFLCEDMVVSWRPEQRMKPHPLCVCCNLRFSVLVASPVARACWCMYVSMLNHPPHVHVNIQAPSTCEMTQCSMQPSGESDLPEFPPLKKPRLQQRKRWEIFKVVSGSFNVFMAPSMSFVQSVPVDQSKAEFLYQSDRGASPGLYWDGDACELLKVPAWFRAASSPQAEPNQVFFSGLIKCLAETWKYPCDQEKFRRRTFFFSHHFHSLRNCFIVAAPSGR